MQADFDTLNNIDIQTNFDIYITTLTYKLIS